MQARAALRRQIEQASKLMVRQCEQVCDGDLAYELRKNAQDSLDSLERVLVDDERQLNRINEALSA